MREMNVPAIPADAAAVTDRSLFITRTYTHLFGAIMAFTAVEYGLFVTGIANRILDFVVATNWLLVLFGFIVIATVASSMAHRALSKPMQYTALGIYVVAEALIFAPILLLADTYYPGVITSAAFATLVGFSVLTAIVFVTRKDFSFMRTALIWVGVGALAAIVASVVLGFELGTLFSIAMIVFAGGVILYNTSNVLHHFPTDRYVAASLELFAAVALMFWYVLRLFMGSRR